MAANNKREAEMLASSAINKWALKFASVAWIPGSHYAMTVGDLAMVTQIGNIYRVDVDTSKAGKIFTAVAAPLIGSKIAHSVLDFLPGIGWAAKSVVALGVTKAVGQALIHYFKDCSPLPE